MPSNQPYITWTHSGLERRHFKNPIELKDAFKLCYDIAIFFGGVFLASSFFASLKLKIPSLYLALISSCFTLSGSCRERSNEL